ncbi:MAG: hypothetical protein WC592_06940 [Candidatus Omnitrophota bacterium]|nr:YtfJ family protein [Candidatus Omnitrophota bacterium]
MISAGPFKIAIITVCSLLLSASPAMCISEGEKAPYFKATSGDNEVLTSDMLNGKIAVVFYETKDTKEKNRALKDDLNVFYGTQSETAQKEIMKVAIIRCSAFMPNIWRRSLRENSKKEGITIYGDWDGSMEKGYGMAHDESNFLIIDKAGVVRYVKAGFIPAEDFPVIKKILNRGGDI